jgi:hypothetical protein
VLAINTYSHWSDSESKKVCNKEQDKGRKNNLKPAAMSLKPITGNIFKTYGLD